MSTQKNILSILQKSDLLIPAVILIVYLIIFFTIRGSLPTATELINDFGSIYARFGYYIIFVSALLESLVVISFFTPGLLAMSMGALFARTGQTQLPLVIITACLGLILGYLIDFLLGQFGFSKLIQKIGYGRIISLAQDKLSSLGPKSLVFGFIYPNIAAFLSLAAGTTKYSFLAFFPLAVGATFFWITFWATLIYFIGDIFLKILTTYSYIIILIAIGLYLTVQKLKSSK